MASKVCNDNDSEGSFTEEQMHELTSRTDEEDVQLKHQFREKRAEYRELINNIQVTNESGVNSKGTLKKMNELFDGVTRIREMAYDAQAVDLFAQRELHNIDNMQTNLVQFNELEFCTKLIEYMGCANQINSLEDEDSSESPEVSDEAWVNLAYEVSSFFKKSPAFHFMHGSFEMGEVEVKKRQVKERELRDKKTPHTKPLEVKHMEKKDRDKTTEEVEKIYETLNRVYEESGNKPVSYFEFCIDPKSFSITVENMFYVAFLVKDGGVSLNLGTNKLPELTPLNKNDENAVPSKQGGNQLVASFSVKDYKDLIQALNIETAVIKRDSE